ncbi:MAG: PEP/pyruvate-binding domain-containing protein, partial [Myxococcota bacterium]
MTLVVSFPGTEQTTLEEVGGKGLSLIRMTAAGLRVPPGAVLTTSFFEPWFDELRASAPWAALAASRRDEWGALSEDLKELCPTLSLTAGQNQALEQLRKSLAALGEDALFAVRSSSPEEDLASASFAGGYETRLGVRLENLDDAVRHCFASSLAERVLVYKAEHGFDFLSPRIAVVVQQQIDSEVAGVGFSLNPLTNDYDEAVIDANWGLGESVVAGQASPDHFVVDKVGRRVLDRKRGAKQVSVWLDPDGGTVERQNHRSAETTLSDAQLSELTDVLCRIEELYEQPVDIEWAYARDELYVLQARPVTAYVPLPPEMVTKPGERRRLYMDSALSDGLTINGPISPMGLDWMDDLLRALMPFVGSSFLGATPESGLAFTAGCRAYANLSELLWLASPKRLAARSADINALMAETLASVDRKRYRTATKPRYLRLWMVRWIPPLLWSLRSFLWNSVRGIVSPERLYRAYEPLVRAYEKEMTRNVDYGLPLAEFRRRYAEKAAPLFFDVTMPALVSFWVGGLMAVDRAFRRESAEVLAVADKLKRGFTGNVVVEMGISLFRLAKLLDRSELDDQTRLAERI